MPEAPESERTMTIYVATLTGKRSTFRVAPSELIGHLMRRYHDREGVPPDQQRLIWAGKQLEEMRSFADCNIHSDDTLCMVLRLRGGKPVVCYAGPGDAVVDVRLELPVGATLSSVWPVTTAHDVAPGRSIHWLMAYRRSSGLLTDLSTAMQLPSLFYEFDAPASTFNMRPERTVRFGGLDYARCGNMLAAIGNAFGLDPTNCCDFVTHWLPQMARPSETAPTICIEVDVLSGEDYARAVPMRCSADERPVEVVTRMFMLWRRLPDGAPSDVSGPAGQLLLTPRRRWDATSDTYSCLLEWGGARLP